MVDLKVLEQSGCTPARIKALFTCEDPECPDYTLRQNFEMRIQNRVNSGLSLSLSHHHLFVAADLAWDSAPIVGENIPLLLYAQKKIKIERCAKELETLSCASQFVRKAADGTIKEIDLPRLYESSINLLRSYITRRLAAQATRFTALYPFFQYAPRSNDPVGKLRGDVLSQRIEMMTDQYGYRHLQTQIIRDMLLYTRSVLFPSSAWDRQLQWTRAPRAAGFEGQTQEPDAKLPVQVTVVREGIDFVRPHPTRVFWDLSFPLSSINNDTGCRYIGFWDLKNYRDIMLEPAYFNRHKILITDNGRNLYSCWPLCFDSTFTPCQIKFPAQLSLRPPLAEGNDNDIQAMRPYYTNDEKDETIFVKEYFEKVIPRECGLGDYPYPVWLRLVVASDKTVLFGEFLPSLPAVYFGFNENDSRYANLSPAHEIMPFQDQVSNLLSQMLLSAKTNALKIVTVDIDTISDEVRAALKQTLAGTQYYNHPVLLEYSGVKARNLGTNAANPITIVEKSLQDSVTGYFSAIAQLMSIMERLMVLSPQELGQSSPSGITAAEVNAITATTTTVYGFIADSIDEGRAAWKKVLYESLISCSTTQINCQVESDYTDQTIEKAGLKGAAVFSGEQSEDAVAKTITGTPEMLVNEYTFSSKDGSQRTQSTLTANTLVQLTGQILAVPGMMEAMGKTRVYELFNEIFRQSGAGVSLNLELKEGEPDTFGAPPDQVEGAIQQMGQAIQQIAKQTADNHQAISQVVDVIGKMTGGSTVASGAPVPLEGPPPLAVPTAPPGGV